MDAPLPDDARNLGAFRLLEPIAEGRMAQVWRGVHDSGLPVAVKVLTGDGAADPTAAALFRNEVRAAARLDHPHIAAVLDFGTVPASVADASDGRFPRRAPYLVMEYAGGGPLHKGITLWSWSVTRLLLAQLLSALAHAHARGIVHRDLKPSNILLAGPQDVRAGIKITDFGIAWVGGSIHSAAGTLAYMAPEQLRGDWASFGAWTDLYALGCLGWRIVTGATPFAHTSGDDMARAHLFESPPALRPLFLVPPELESWLRELLHKDPATRFGSAADALAALEALGDIEALPTRGSRVAAAYLAERRPEALARLPVDRLGVEPPAPMRLRGAGLNLFALREIPLFGRSGERALLWRELRRVESQRTIRRIWIRGPAGVGKSHLARWLSLHAAEHGGIRTLSVRGEALAEGVAQLLGASNLEPDHLDAHVRQRLQHAPDPQLASILIAGLLDAGIAAEDRWLAAVVQLIELYSTRRPLILSIDPACRAPSAWRLLELLGQHSGRAVLVLLICSDESLAEVGEAEARLEALLGQGERMRLGSLEVTAWHELLQHLGLSGTLASQIDQRARGNPLFAVQLVGDWVQRGLVEASADGLALTEDAEIDVPDALYGIWVAHMERILEGLSASAKEHLERAAVMGLVIDEALWGSSCDDPFGGKIRPAGRSLREVLVERMLDARLIELRTGGWGFVQPMLREVLVAGAREEGRWAEHHRALGYALLISDDPDPMRVGEHLLEAGDALAAVGHLLKGVHEREVRHGILAVGAGLSALERALHQAAVPEADVRWAYLWRLRSDLVRRRGQPREAEQLAARGAALAKAAGDVEIWAWCVGNIAMSAQAQGELGETLELLKKAVKALLRADARGRVLALLLARMVAVARMMNQLEDAERWANQALATLARCNVSDPVLETNLLAELAALANQQGDHERALVLIEEAEEVLRASPHATPRAILLTVRGDAQKGLGHWLQAEAAYTSAAEQQLRLGLPVVVPSINLAICRIQRGAWDGVLRAVERVSRSWPTEVDRAVAGLCRFIAELALGEEARAQHVLEPSLEILRSAELVSGDAAALARHGAKQALDRGRDDLARALLAFALEQLEALGDRRGCAEVDAELRDLGGPL